ncbi:MAG TPA: phospholipase D-like domain-containing protein [Candidatus Saccharimonadia bacterium]|nr:phospholipase D-like domain-containing protein [Candidatus Saccharimonadia bacterium]
MNTMKNNQIDAETSDQERIVRAVERATGSKFRAGNQCTVLQNGDEIFPAMLQAIRGAKVSVEFLTYVFWRGSVASEFADALSERARAGVDVRLLLDAAGGATIGARTVWLLERAGVRVEWFRPGRFKYIRQLNHRTHRKILIVDGSVAFTGGVGIADEWRGSAQDKKHWRETHCRIVGPAVIDMHRGFADSWLETTGVRLEIPEPAAHKSDISVHTTISTSGDAGPTDMERLFMAVIKGARHRLWITTAYFVPSEYYVCALVAAAGKGVDVRILTNGNLSNHKLALLAGRASYSRLLDAGVKIYEYQKTVLHAKVMTADRCYATIGSTNLDDRSLVLNDELNVSVTDTGVVGALDLKFLKDLKESKHIRSTHWYQRGWVNQLAERGSSVFRGQL